MCMCVFVCVYVCIYADCKHNSSRHFGGSRFLSLLRFISILYRSKPASNGVNYLVANSVLNFLLESNRKKLYLFSAHGTHALNNEVV